MPATVYGTIDFGNDGIREPLVERVSHDADDLKRVVTERERRPPEPGHAHDLTERGSSVEAVLDEPFVDEHDVLRAVHVVAGQEPAGHESNPERVDVAVVNVMDLHEVRAWRARRQCLPALSCCRTDEDRC